MQADPIRGRFTSVSTDFIVMPALAGVAILFATHRLTIPFERPFSYGTRATADMLIFCLFFGIVSHFAFSFSLLHQCRARSRSMLLLSLLRSCGLTTYMLAFYLVRSHQAMHSMRTLSLFFISAVVYQAVRYNVRVARLIRHREAVLILGTGREAQKAWRHLRIDCDQLVTFKGFVAASERTDAAPDIVARTVCTIDTLETFLEQSAIDTLVLTARGPDDFAFAEAAKRVAIGCGVRLLGVEARAQRLPTLRWLHLASEGYVELYSPNASTRAPRALKAVVDRVLAGAGLLLMLPITLPLFLLYQLMLGEFPLVSQSADGYHRRRFTMWDLRIAPSRRIVVCDASMNPTPRLAATQAKLVARVGHFLKISGLARAPRLWNVVAGEMSLVGPRPVLRDQVPIVGARVLLRRYTMRPGLCWPKPEQGQTEDDATLAYLDHWSLGLDWKTFTHWFRSRVRRTLYAISAPLIPDHAPLAKPTQRT